VRFGEPHRKKRKKINQQRKEEKRVRNMRKSMMEKIGARQNSSSILHGE